MPKYEYVCINCDISVEINRGFNDEEEIPACSECGYRMARSWNSSPSIVFKGPGFYSTDK